MKTYLLDTCALLWWMADAPELSSTARRVIAGRRNEIVISVASLWEIAIKNRRGRLTGVEEYLRRYAELHAGWGFSMAVIEPADAVAAGRLAINHEDPFDRMLIVQSQRTGALLVTCDEAIRRHTTQAVW